jgi:HEAT repeat protein
LLGERASYELAEVVRPLTTHRDPGVASAACLIRIRAAGGELEESMGAEIKTGERISSVGSGPERITGQTRAGAFARELPELLISEHSETRKEVIEVMSQLALPHFIVPLIACLTQSDVRRRAIAALVAYGDRALSSVRENLSDDDLALVARVSLLRVLEGVASREALMLLLAQCRARDHAMRDHAAEALFRLTVKDGALQPRGSALEELVVDEIKRLKTYAAIEVMLGGLPTPRKLLFLSEVQSEGQRAEQRAFRALGMLYDRDAIVRAYRNYRAREHQTRSNAIELLEQHITDPALLEFVQLIERSEDKHGNLRPQSVVYQALAERHSVEQLLGEEPWLARLWAWVSERDGKRLELGWEDELDRVVVLKRLPLFRASSGSGLLPVAREMRRKGVSAGESVLTQGVEGDQVYWLLDGKAEVLVDERRVATLSATDVFGEVGALDGGARSASVRAIESGTVLVLERTHFDDAIDVNPTLIHGLLSTLSRRVRDAWTLHGRGQV